MDQKKQLDQLTKKLVEANVCPELASSAKNLVMGAGSENANVMFIGEAPGKQEDEQGQPFVGAAGKFLNQMLESIGLEREDVYITNIVKYRPPGNRDPLDDEKEAFWPYLAKQIEIIRPKVIVTLGRHSMNFFLPDASISKIHGQPKRIRVKYNQLSQKALEPNTLENHEFATADEAKEQDFNQLIILPLYHPAAALYNGSMRSVLIDDFSIIPILLSKYSNSSKTKAKE